MIQKIRILLFFLFLGSFAFAQNEAESIATPKVKDLLKENINTSSISVNEENRDLIIQSKDVDMYPNPAQGKTNLIFKLPESSIVEVSIINMVGKTVLQNNLGKLPRGEHDIPVELYAVSPGMYIVTVKIGNYQVTKRLNVVQ